MVSALAFLINIGETRGQNPFIMVSLQDFSWFFVWETLDKINSKKEVFISARMSMGQACGDVIIHWKGDGDAMKDKHKHSSEQQEFSNGISTDQSPQEIKKKLRAEFFRTAVFALVSLFVIVLVSIAWFVSNSRVDSRGIMISHQFDTIKLATKGYRQVKEEKLLNLNEGSVVEYNDETYYYTEQGEIALHLSDSEVKVSPGMSGEISFYIIPNHTGSQTVTLHLGLAGYEETKDKNGNVTGGNKINDLVLNSLLSGHILMFQSYERGQYDDWLPPGNVTAGGSDYQIKVTNSKAKKGEPWEVKLYWVWPLRYKNMAEDFTVNNKNLLFDFIEAQTQNLNQIGNTSYYYSQIFLTKNLTKNENLNSDDSRSNAYNQADEYIGTKADYLYVTIQTDLVN